MTKAPNEINWKNDREDALRILRARHPTTNEFMIQAAYDAWLLVEEMPRKKKKEFYTKARNFEPDYEKYRSQGTSGRTIIINNDEPQDEPADVSPDEK